MNRNIHVIKDKLSKVSKPFNILGLYDIMIKQNNERQKSIIVAPSNIDQYCGGLTRDTVHKILLT